MTSMKGLNFRDCEDCGDIVQTHPVFAGVLAILLGALTYAGMALVLRGLVPPVETVVFGVLFGVGFTALKYLGSR